MQGTNFKKNIAGKYLFYHIAAMQQLYDHIFDGITKLWSDKRQPNDNLVENNILKTVELLTQIQLEVWALI